jgi:hypothetical protein
MQILTPDLCVIGAGSGGLSLAAGAAQMGAHVVLVEGGEMGGDCLNTGCVPSKALLAAGKAAGYGRAEVLGGLINGLFLVFIAFFVFKEALEVRVSTPVFARMH